MKLIEALEIVRQPPPAEARPFAVWLCCSFTPLHLVTFLRAHLRLALPERRAEVTTGLYGDLAGTLARAAETPGDVCIITLEWPDFDPRLGLRHLGGWEPELLGDILREAEGRLAQLKATLQDPAAKTPFVLSMPTLPPVPASFASVHQAGEFDARLEELAARLAAELAGQAGLKLVNPHALAQLSPPAARHDVRSELATGFPYSTAHASALASLLAKLAAPPAPKKGLITDLDDTLWCGIVGDDGVDGIAWDLDHHAQPHGLYQQMLRSLARSGVLVGVATKNNPAMVEQALRRRDLLVRAEDLYPIEVSWGPKSESVARVLQAWNIAADSVVLIDDSPMELEEVGRAHAGLECIRFPKDDPEAVYRLCFRLRELFGKATVREEDRLRSASLRGTAQLRQAASGAADLDALLRDAQAVLSFSWNQEPPDPRALELIHKTNQFNLNGRRFAEAEWGAYLRRPDTHVLLVEYRDKYGPLGKIAALAGRQEGRRWIADTWVMSCRAFSRRIEHHTLKLVFERFAVEEIQLEFVPTERNSPFQEFLSALLDSPSDGPVSISRARFFECCPGLYHARE